MNELKIAIIGAGSVSFCPATLKDIALSDKLNTKKLTVALMDIKAEALDASLDFGNKIFAKADREVEIFATTDLDKAIDGATFVVTAIEVERYWYWSQDFHIPRKLGFRQVYGENGGPGGMFHFLRNIEPIMHIARRMEALCPDAFLLNYTNPEAKIVEAVTKLTNIKIVGICHGFDMGRDQIAEILNKDLEELEIWGCGLNHFGWIHTVKDKATGEDLYPKVKEIEASGNWLAKWDEIGLSRIMFRTYGMWPYPGTNHIGEYVVWADDFLASKQIQFFHDPKVDRFKEFDHPQFVYDFCSNPTNVKLDDNQKDLVMEYQNNFDIDNIEFKCSGEYGIPIMEAILFDENITIPALNQVNEGQMPGVMIGMCVEGPTLVNKEGFALQEMPELPAAVTAMINLQGAIHNLVIEAYIQKSKSILLQAILLDPTVSSYNNAVHLIDEMFEKQSEILPKMEW